MAKWQCTVWRYGSVATIGTESFMQDCQTKLIWSPCGPHSPAPPHYAHRAEFVRCSVEILYSLKQPEVCRDYRQTSPEN